MNLHYYGCEETLICCSASKQYLTLEFHDQYTLLLESRMMFTAVLEKEIRLGKIPKAPSFPPETL